MFGWPKKKLPKTPKPIVFGRYQLKPVVGRAVPYVMGVDAPSFANLVATSQLSLNGSLVTEDRLSERLEAGQYTIRQTDTRASWQFFIA